MSGADPSGGGNACPAGGGFGGSHERWIMTKLAAPFIEDIASRASEGDPPEGKVDELRTLGAACAAVATDDEAISLRPLVLQVMRTVNWESDVWIKAGYVRRALGNSGEVPVFSGMDAGYRLSIAVDVPIAPAEVDALTFLRDAWEGSLSEGIDAAIALGLLPPGT